jgi:hypothetical protein
LSQPGEGGRGQGGQREYIGGANMYRFVWKVQAGRRLKRLKVFPKALERILRHAV